MQGLTPKPKRMFEYEGHMRAIEIADEEIWGLG
jgi:hypothetical protein